MPASRPSRAAPLLLALGATWLAGCGDSGAPPPPPADARPATPPPPAGPDIKPIPAAQPK